jgi:hypothetical protein
MSHIPLVNGDTYATLRAFLNEMSSNMHNIYDEVTTLTTASKTVSSVTTANLFTISGGPIRVNDIIGYITTAIGVGANNTKLVYTSTGGSAVDLCAVLNVASSSIRRCLSISGVAADALKLSPAEGVVVQVEATSAYVKLQPGVISLNCSGTNTGVIKWDLEYVPITSLSTVTPA